MKDIFVFYFNILNHIVLKYSWSVNGKANADFMCCLATKEYQIPHVFKKTRIVLPWKQNCEFETRNLICLMVCLFMQYCKIIIRLRFWFCFKIVSI